MTRHDVLPYLDEEPASIWLRAAQRAVKEEEEKDSRTPKGESSSVAHAEGMDKVRSAFALWREVQACAPVKNSTPTTPTTTSTALYHEGLLSELTYWRLMQESATAAAAEGKEVSIADRWEREARCHEQLQHQCTVQTAVTLWEGKRMNAMRKRRQTAMKTLTEEVCQLKESVRRLRRQVKAKASISLLNRFKDD